MSSVDVRVALDAMGGDHAPEAIIQGAILATERDPRLSVTVVGPRERLEPLIGGRPAIRLLHASEWVGMDESPVEALRRKKDNSIQRAMELVMRGEADGFVSAGHTGAVVACATLSLGPLEGVRRPGIAVTFPSRGGPVTLMDVGANLKCKPIHLLQYGVMAGAYAEAVLGKSSPTVGLLNIGSEEAKGNDLVKETSRLFRESGLAFVGNVEGQEIFLGKCDVFVCEGFVGNLILKVVEGFGVGLLELLKREFGAVAGISKASGAEFEKVFARVYERVDYAEYGGAPLLGVKGIVIIAHGRSNAKATANAIGVATGLIRARVNERITASLAGRLPAERRG